MKRERQSWTSPAPFSSPIHPHIASVLRSHLFEKRTVILGRDRVLVVEIVGAFCVVADEAVRKLSASLIRQRAILSFFIGYYRPPKLARLVMLTGDAL